MNEEQLFKYAAENTRRILPPRIRNMNDVMKEMFLSDGMPEEIAEMMIREVPPEQTLWIISNNRGIDGAVSVSYTHLDVYKRQLRMYWSLQDWRIKQHIMKVIWNRR